MNILISFFLGIFSGLLGHMVIPETYVHEVSTYAKLPGSIFLGILQLSVFFLLFPSLSLAIITSEQDAKLRKLSFVTFGYYIFTTLVVVILGILVFSTLSSFYPIDLAKSLTSGITESVSAVKSEPMKSIPEIITGLFPSNPIRIISQNEMLSLVIFSIMFGFAIKNLNKSSQDSVEDFMEIILKVSYQFISWAIYIAPVGVFCLSFSSAVSLGTSILSNLSFYLAAIFTGFSSILIFYFFLIYFLCRYNPFQFLQKIKSVLFFAFSTSSSGATLPLTIQTVEENLKIPSNITRFVLPIGATINMDGTAMFQIIATLFLAKLYGITFSVLQLITLAFTVVGISIGTAAAPGVGIILLAAILGFYGIPTEGIAIIIGVDRFLDMCRTTINVLGDMIACTWIARKFT